MVGFGDLTACANCGSSDAPLRTCTRCRSSAYCGAVCQRSHYGRHKAACRAAASAGPDGSVCRAAASAGPDGCRNAEANPWETVDLPDSIPPHVVPSVAPVGGGRQGYTMCYRDSRRGRPWMVESPVPETGEVERGSVGEMSFHLVPGDVENVPRIPPPRKMMVKGGGNVVADGGMTKEEHIATLLNAFNVRHYIHKVKQGGGNFVIMIEFDARMVENPSSQEATVCLTVTLRSDGLGNNFPDDQRKIYLHANFDDVEPGSMESVASEWVGSTTADSPWATVRGLLPMSIDFVLNHPFYKGIISRAKHIGKRVEIRLYDCSPVLGLRGEAQTSDDQVTRMMYFMQSAMMAYAPIELCRLPDGYTGEDVDADPESVVRVMRRLEESGKFVGQLLLVTDEERCVPHTTMREEAFRVRFDDLEMEWH